MENSGTGGSKAPEKKQRNIRTYLTQEWIDAGNLAKLREELAAGTPQRFAGLFLDDPICQSTFYNWVNAGKQALSKMQNNKALTEDETCALLFYGEVEKGLAEFLKDRRKKLDKAAEDGNKAWAAYMTELERRFPSIFGRIETLKHEGGEDFGKRSLVEAIAAYKKQKKEIPHIQEEEDEDS